MIGMSILLVLFGQTWAKAYDRLYEDYSQQDTAYSIAADVSDNAYVVVGHTDKGPLGNIDVLVTKVSAANGNVLWARAYGFPGEFDDYGRSVIVDYTEDETYYAVTGYTIPGFQEENYADVIVFKIRAVDGSLVWGYLYSGWGFIDEYWIPLADYAYSIIEDGGSYLVAGNVEPAPCGGASDALVLSVNANTGLVNWSFAYGKIIWEEFPTDDYAYSIIEDLSEPPPNLFVVAGKSFNAVEWPKTDILVFKGEKETGMVDPATGALRDYIVGQHACAYSIKNDHQPGYILTGDVDSSIVVMRLNPDLSPGWAGKCRTYSIQDLVSSRCIETTSDSNYVIVGYTNPGIPGPFDVLTVKIDKNGFVIWSKVLTGCPTTTWMNLNDYGQEILEYPKGFYGFAGYTDWPSSWGTTNFLAGRMDKNGIIPCYQTSDTCTQDLDLVVDSPMVDIEMSVCVNEVEMDTIPISEIPVYIRDSLICRSEEIGIEDRTSAIYDVYNFPNPFRDRTVISIQYAVGSREELLTPYSLFPTIRIYDLAGRLIRTLNPCKSVQSVVWDGKDEKEKRVPAGIYFCKVEAEGFTQTHKMVMMR